jgi:hypothetical protein
MSSYKWGFVNINMGQKFPHLRRLRLVGGSMLMHIALPSDVVLQNKSPCWNYMNHVEEIPWTSAMAYNFVRELPSTLTSLICHHLLLLASEINSTSNDELLLFESLPLPPSLTELHGRDLSQFPDLPPTLVPQLKSVAMRYCKRLDDYNSLTRLQINHQPQWNCWTDFVFPRNLTALHLYFLLGPQIIELQLPPNLKTFDAPQFFQAKLLPPGWFPDSLTKLRLSPTNHLPWGESLPQHLPPRLEYLKIGFAAGPVNFEDLPRSLKVFKFSWLKNTFKNEHVAKLPPGLTAFSIYSDFSISKEGWTAFPPSLTYLKLANVLNGATAALSLLPGLKRAKLASTSLLEDNLPKLSNSLLQLELKEVILTGSSLSRFSSDDHVLTSQKWNELMKKSLPPSLELLWDFRYTEWSLSRSLIPKLALALTAAHKPLFFPSHITEIDLGDMAIPEGVVLEAISNGGCQIRSLRLADVSLSHELEYPQTLTELVAVVRPELPSAYPRSSVDYSPHLQKLIIPLITMMPVALPSSLTHLELYCATFRNPNHLTQLQTLVMNTTEFVSTKFLPPNITSFECPYALNVEFFDQVSPDRQQLPHLTTLKLPEDRHGLPLTCIPQTVTNLHLYNVHASAEPMTQALKNLAHKSAEHNDKVAVRLLVNDWLPGLQNLTLTFTPGWETTLEQMELLPESTLSLTASLPPNPLSHQSREDWGSQPLRAYAHMRKNMLRPLQIALTRFTSLTELDISTTVLPHYATEWLPRTLKVLDVDNTLFSARSFSGLPPTLHCLGLWGKVMIRAASATSLPRSVRYLHLYTIKTNAYRCLPRELLHLSVSSDTSPLWPSTYDLPPSLRSLDLQWASLEGSNPIWSRLPPNLRSMNVQSPYQYFKMFKHIQASRLLPQAVL